MFLTSVVSLFWWFFTTFLIWFPEWFLMRLSFRCSTLTKKSRTFWRPNSRWSGTSRFCWIRWIWPCTNANCSAAMVAGRTAAYVWRRPISTNAAGAMDSANIRRICVPTPTVPLNSRTILSARFLASTGCIRFQVSCRKNYCNIKSRISLR